MSYEFLPNARDLIANNSVLSPGGQDLVVKTIDAGIARIAELERELAVLQEKYEIRREQMQRERDQYSSAHLLTNLHTVYEVLDDD